MVGMGYFYPVIGDEWGPIGGRELRYLLTWRLSQASGPMSVAELVRWCDRMGVILAGRPSKVISDALRWEVIWGRVERLSRGVYCFTRTPRSTWVWIRRRAEAAFAHIGWARNRRSDPHFQHSAPVWGPQVTTPPWSTHRALQPMNPVLRARPRKYKRIFK